jgi:hypothetical protein
LDAFVREQEQMVGKLHVLAFVSTIGDSFSNPMWAILNQMMRYGRNESNFNATCIEVCRMLEKIKRYLRGRTENEESLPELANQ